MEPENTAVNDELQERWDRAEHIRELTHEAGDPYSIGGLHSIGERELEAVKDILKALQEYGIQFPGIFPLLDAPGFFLEWIPEKSTLVDIEVTEESAKVTWSALHIDDVDIIDVIDVFPLWDTEGIAARVQDAFYRG